MHGGLKPCSSAGVKRITALSFVAAGLLVSTRGAAADAELPGLSVTVAKDARTVKVTRASGTRELAVEGVLKVGQKPEVTTLGVGGGKAIVRVVVPLQDGAWEALLSPSEDSPLFAGRTGYSRGTEGEREGTKIDVVPRSDGTKSVLVSDIREDTRICGDATTALRPRGLDPKTLTLRGATLQRLSAEARAGAKKVRLERVTGTRAAPGAKLLSLAGESGGAGEAKHLLDDRADTAWTEDRPGVGQGEFVTFRAPTEVPIDRVVFGIAPSTGVADFAAPHTFYLVTPGEVRELTVPEDAAFAAGGEVEMKLATPLRADCLSIVLGDAYAEGAKAPRVGFAGVWAYSPLDTRPLATVAKELSSGGESAAAATAFLKRAGAPGLAAIAETYATLDPGGRARAIDVATAAPSCEAAGDVLLLGVVDPDKEASRKARDRIERCGKGAAKALATGLASKDAKLRAVSAELFGLVAPREALEPLVSALGRGEREERSAVRAAVAKAARNAPPATLEGWLGAEKAEQKRIEMLRAFSGRLGEIDKAEALLAAATKAPEMGSRYVLVEAARAFSLARPERPSPLVTLLEDADPHVRAHAAEGSAGVPALGSRLVARLADPEPRVREAALGALGTTGTAPEGEAGKLVVEDEWTFVRIAAANALGASKAPSEAGNAALEKVLASRSPHVAPAALLALGERHASRSAGAMAALAKDQEAQLDLRVAAVRALGAVCASSELDYLGRAAERALHPVDEADLRLGVAALDALGRIHPPDLAKRLEKLRAKDVRTPLRHAAERALVEPTTCAR